MSRSPPSLFGCQQHLAYGSLILVGTLVLFWNHMGKSKRLPIAWEGTWTYNPAGLRGNARPIPIFGDEESTAVFQASVRGNAHLSGAPSRDFVIFDSAFNRSTESDYEPYL